MQLVLGGRSWSLGVGRMGFFCLSVFGLVPTLAAPSRPWGFAEALGAIRREYVRDVNLREVAVSGLTRLSEIDSEIRVNLDAGNLVVSLSGREILRKGAARSGDSEGWGRRIEQTIDALRGASSKLAAVEWVEIQRRIFDGFIDKLDRECGFVPDLKVFYKSASRDLIFQAVPHGLDVLSVTPGGSAEAAGIRPGDVITRLDSVPTAGMSVVQAIERLAGPTGSELRVTVQCADGSAGPETTIVRQGSSPPRVGSEVDGDILYLRVPPMDSEADVLVRQPIEAAMKDGVRGVILDLRSHQGGLLETAIRLADLFLPAGGRIANVQGRNPYSTGVYRSHDLQFADELRVAVLINGSTAEGAELVAAALQEERRAVVVGSGSLGRSSIQRAFPLPGTAALILTTGTFSTGRNRSLEPDGVAPDVCTNGSAEEPSEILACARASAEEGGSSKDARAPCAPERVERALDIEVAREVLRDDDLYHRLLQ